MLHLEKVNGNNVWDILIFLFDLPTEQCLEGAIARIGHAREDLPWIETEFDPELRQCILDFQREQIPKIYELLENYRKSKMIVTFRSRQEADDWIENGYQLLNRNA